MVKKAISAKQTQAVKKIVKQVLKKAPETKSYLSPLISHLPLDNTWIVQNLFFDMATGTGGSNFIGRKIYVKSLTFRCCLYSATTFDSTILARMIVFKHKDSITNSAVVSANGNQFLRSNASNSLCQHFDYNKTLRKYADKQWALNKTTNNTQSYLKPFTFTIPINKYHKWTGDNTGTFEDGQYFLAFTGFNGQGTSQPVSINYQYSINFTDE